jgi:hypothetical protein
MPSRLTTIAVASAIGVGALTASVAVPALADTVTGTTSASDAVEKRVSSIREALQGLVDDKTITDAQADKVAERLGSSEAFRGPGPGGHRHGFVLGGSEGLAAVAKVLGMEADDVKTALRDGTTLKELAEKQGKSSDDVVSALVTAAKAQLAEAVEDGRLTQERADELSASMESRIEEFVENGRPAKGDGPGRGWPGHGHGGGMGPWGGGGGGDEAPQSPTPSPSSTTRSSFLNT